MRARLATLAAAVALLVVTPAPRAASRTFTGVISDDMCAVAGPERMQMGPTDAECTRACIDANGASYVLLVGKTVYTLSDQTTPARFAGQRVTVSGTLDTKSNTIRVASMVAAKGGS